MLKMGESGWAELRSKIELLCPCGAVRTSGQFGRVPLRDSGFSERRSPEISIWSSIFFFGSSRDITDRFLCNVTFVSALS
jgi:hypothetical protein